MTVEEKKPSTAHIRVLIVDDHEIVRKGIRAVLAETPGFEVVGEAGNGQDALVRAEETRPDVILMDLLMPGMGGVGATRRISSSQSQTRILVLTSVAADNNVFLCQVPHKADDKAKRSCQNIQGPADGQGCLPEVRHHRESVRFGEGKQGIVWTGAGYELPGLNGPRATKVQV